MANERSVVPPPPAEAGGNASLTAVSVRTMASDMDLLGRTGGTAAMGTLVTVSIAKTGSSGKHAVTVTERGDASGAVAGKGGNFILWSIIIAVAVPLLFLLGYYVIPLLFPAAPADSSASEPTAPPPSLPKSATPASVFLVHESFFRSDPDDRLSVVFNARGGDASPPFAARVKEEVTRGRAEAAFFEVAVKTGEGQQMAWGDFLGALRVALPPQFLEEKFERDFTAFLSRDARGLHPGYIAKLRAGQPLVVLRTSFQPYEEALAAPQFFLDPPRATQGGFRDTQVAGQPARELSFEDPAGDLIYGWFYNTYLIVSTSREGLQEALQRL